MTATNILVPKIIFDKNGKRTTVMVNPFKVEHTKRALPVIHRGQPLREPWSNTPNGAGKVPYQQIYLDGKEMRLAPEGFSGAYCETCNSFYTKDELSTLNWWKDYICSNCGAGNLYENMPVALEYDSQRFLDPEAVYDEVWYHSTVRANWHEDIFSSEATPMVHLGTLEAAAIRANFTGNFFKDNDAAQVYNYAVRIKRSAPIGEVVKYDENGDTPSLASQTAAGYELDGVTRYVNRYEAPGVISLLANPSSFEIIERFVLDRPDFSW